MVKARKARKNEAKNPHVMPMRKTKLPSILSLILSSLVLRLAGILGAVAVEPCSLGIGMTLSNRLSNGVAA